MLTTMCYLTFVFILFACHVGAFAAAPYGYLFLTFRDSRAVPIETTSLVRPLASPQGPIGPRENPDLGPQP